MSDQVSTEPPAQPAHTEGAPAGWYVDPDAPLDPARRRWWDGASWGDHMVWSGSSWVDVDAIGTTAPSPRRRRRLLWWVLLGGLVLALGGCGVILLLGFGMDAVLTHDLVDTDFGESADPFEVGSDPEVGAYAFELVDGAYRIRATGPNDSAASSLGEYARIAYSVDTTVEVLEVDEGSTVAVGCLSSELFGYVVTVGPDGAVLYRIAADGSDDVVAAAAEVQVPDVPFTLGLDCEQTPTNPDDLQILGLVDGRRVLSFTDTDAVSGLAYVELGMMPGADDASATFGDVLAVVPGG